MRVGTMHQPIFKIVYPTIRHTSGKSWYNAQWQHSTRQYDGNAVVSWDDCGWKPQDLKTKGKYQ